MYTVEVLPVPKSMNGGLGSVKACSQSLPNRFLHETSTIITNKIIILLICFIGIPSQGENRAHGGEVVEGV
jgi:hypothetical protein